MIWRFVLVASLVLTGACRSGSPPAPSLHTDVVASLPSSPAAVAVSSAGVWVAFDSEGVLRRYETSGDPNLEPVDLPGAPVALAAGADVVWVALFLDRSVVAIDQSGQQTTQVAFDGAPVDLALSGSDLWVATIEPDQIHRIDVRTGAHRGDPLDLPEGATRVAAGPEGVWAAGEDTVRRLGDDPVSVGVGRVPLDMAVAAGVLWVPSVETDEIARLSALDGREVAPPITDLRAPIAVEAYGERVWALSQDTRTVMLLDDPPARAKARTEGFPRSMAVDPTGRAWVATTQPNQLVMIDVVVEEGTDG